MHRTFNCGVGMVVVVAPKDVDATVAEFGRIDCLVNSAYQPPAFTLFEANQGRWSPNDTTTIDILRTVQIAAGGAFFAVAIGGVLDALAHAPPRETVMMKEPRPAPSPTTSLSIGPGGLALRGVF